MDEIELDGSNYYVIFETRIVNYNRKTRQVTIRFRRKDSSDKRKGYATETMPALELIARLIQHIHFPRLHYTRYLGQYSVRRRGIDDRNKKKPTRKNPAKIESITGVVGHAYMEGLRS